MNTQRRFVPYEKLSKSEQRRVNARRRGSWNGVLPVTRREKSKKRYVRVKIISSEDE